MGNQPGKQQSVPSRDDPRLSRRKSKTDLVEDTHKDIRNLRYTIENRYDSSKSDNYFSELQKRAEDLQDVRRSMKKPSQISKCNAAIKEINDCINVLKDRQEENLDLEAVESDSFVCQDVKQFEEVKKPNHNRIERISQIENFIDILDKEIRESFRVNDMNKLTILGKKTEILYKDIEQITPPATPVMRKRQEVLAEKLLKMNKKINSTTARVVPKDNLLTIMKIEQDLSDLEVQALTFEDTKSDSSYVALNKKLRQHFGTLENIHMNSEDVRRRVLNAKALIKKIISELEKKVAANDVTIKKELSDLALIKEEVDRCQKDVAKFNGTANGDEYIALDQKLRSIWANLTHLGTFEKVKLEKAVVIKEIQTNLKALNDKAGKIGKERSNSMIFKDLVVKAEALQKEFHEFQAASKNVDIRKHASLHNILEDVEHSVKLVLHGDYVSTPQLPVTNEDAIVSIQEIDDELQKLQGEINQYEEISDPDIQDQIENKLIGHKHALEAIDSNNPIITVAKDRVIRRSHDVTQSFLDKVNEKPSYSFKRQSVQSINTSKESIIDIETNLAQVEKDIGNFKETKISSEYGRIYDDISEYKYLLEKIDVRSYEELWDLKIQVLRYIEKLQTNLDAKADDNEKAASDKAKMKSILRHLQALQKSVDCFHGTYKNPDYVYLETELQSNLQLIDSIKSDSRKIIRAQTSTKETIRKLLESLDEKSIKANNDDQIETAKNAMLKLRDQMEAFDGTYQDKQYNQLLADLESCVGQVVAIPTNSETEIMKSQYLQYLNDLKIYLEERARSNEDHFLVQKIGASIDDLNRGIDNFKQTKFSEEYNQLDDSLTGLASELNKINLNNNPELLQKHSDLVLSLNATFDCLENKAKENLALSPNGKILIEIEEIGSDLAKLGQKIVAFSGEREDADYVQLDEALVKNFLELDKIKDLNDAEIKKAKREVMNEIQKNMKLLDNKVALA